jgi:hypothetical protein
MKKIQVYIALIITLFTIVSCEDVVDVKLDTANSKLVIDAVINWQKGTSGNEQKIKLSKTTNFYSDVIPPATGATVTIVNTTSDLAIVYVFNEIDATGEYVCNNFNPIINDEFKLTVEYEGQTYTSKAKLFATPAIENIEQTLIPGFSGNEVVQVKFYYQDNGNEDNNYLVGFKNSKIAFPEYGVVKDEFFQGNLMFGLYIDEDLKRDDFLNLSVQGISEKYSNYMTKLLSIAGSTGGNPFATPPATLRGNIVNQTNPDNYPLGYFHLSEIDAATYTVQ